MNFQRAAILMLFLEIFILVSQERAKEDNQCIVFLLTRKPRRIPLCCCGSRGDQRTEPAEEFIILKTRFFGGADGSENT